VNDEAQSRVAALERELAEERRARQALVETSVQLNSMLNLPELLRAIVGSASELLQSETGSLMMLDKERNELAFEVVSGEELKELRVPADQGIAGWVIQHGEPAIVDDVPNDPRFYDQIDRSSGFTTRSMLAVPLKLRDRTIGVIELMNKQGGPGFTERDQELATALAAQAAVAIENARLYRTLADAVVAARISYKL
jgi:GAF domain-containing protein